MEQEDLDQSEAFRFLGDGATYGLPEPPRRIDTHGAAVFLAGSDVYKVKRAVRFPFMDFSSLEKRRRSCENELAVNKANAPQIYLGVTPISKDGSKLKLGEGGRIVEWAVHLRRFDENSTLDHLAERGELDLDLIAKLADVVAESHCRAPIVKDRQSTRSLKAQLEETLAAFTAAPEVFAPQAVARLQRAAQDAFARVEPLLLEREACGQARRSHGDLHLRNIVRIDGAPVLFDALEFDESLATCDVLYDLAFLLMDLWTRELRREANALLNRYLSACSEPERQIEGLAALPFFLALRAAIRAKVSNLQPSRSKEHIDAARRYFAAAEDFLRSREVDLVAIGGFSGTGKSSLARILAPSIGRAPGALHLRSDVERKQIFKVSEYDRLPEAAYRPEASTLTYERLRRKAALALAAGQSVVLDAVHQREEDRRAAREIARCLGAHFTGLWLEAPNETLFERVGRRTKDASDATQAVVAAQVKEKVEARDWTRLDASGPIGALADEALARIGQPQAPK